MYTEERRCKDPTPRGCDEVTEVQVEIQEPTEIHGERYGVTTDLGASRRSRNTRSHGQEGQHNK